MHQFEKLGMLFLGKKLNPENMQITDEYFLYRSKDLINHAVCIGLPGSGKTGLCSTILEEAAMDDIPAIVIDPKGDMSNLLVSFTDLATKSIKPRINSQDQQNIWETALKEWGQDVNRQKDMREKINCKIYTPGSTVGKSLSIPTLLLAPPKSLIRDKVHFTELITITTELLLGIVRIHANPNSCKEGILISNILLNEWKKECDLDLTGLIQRIQAPLFSQVGAMSLESFFSKKDRFDLALKFNLLISSPEFDPWMEGEHIDIDKLLYSPNGNPKISILSMNGLSYEQKILFVTLILKKLNLWVKTKEKTSSLRALLYIDEMNEFFPPDENPPSKSAITQLLESGGDVGLGVMLTTQNTTNLNYNELSNVTTWFIGKLPNHQDKEYILEGLDKTYTCSGLSLDKVKTDRLISSLGQRDFLMHDIKNKGVALFQTRWCMSYLREALSQNEIKTLVGDKSHEKVILPAKPVILDPLQTISPIPKMPEKIRQMYIPYKGSPDRIIYRPCITAFVEVHYSDNKNEISKTVEEMLIVPANKGIITVDWNKCQKMNLHPNDLETACAKGASFLSVPSECQKITSYTEWKRDLKDYLYHNYKLTLYKNDYLNKISMIGESRRDFQIRMTQESRQEREWEIENLRESYKKKIKTLEEKIRKTQQAVKREKAQAKDAGVQTAISLGTTILGVLLANNKVSTTNLGRAATTARGLSRTAKQQGDVNRWNETVKTYKAQLDELQENLNLDINLMHEKLRLKVEDIAPFEIKPLKQDCIVKGLVFTWEPVRINGNNEITSAW